MRAVGVKEFLARKFVTFDFDGQWEASFGKPERNFSMLVYGASGNGKTDFCVKLAKYCAGFGRVYYNSFEEGVSKTLQNALKRNNMQEVAGKVVFGDRESYGDMMKRLGKRNSPHFIFIDSRDYMELTHGQYKKMRDQFPRKSFVVISWSKNGKPYGEHAKKIQYMVDIKVNVRQFKAYPRCRFGGNEPFVIWDGWQKKIAQSKLF